MSGYGWLTESALLPKPSKPINVDNSSVPNFHLKFLTFLVDRPKSHARKREKQSNHWGEGKKYLFFLD
jgi:hypothetical protein